MSDVRGYCPMGCGETLFVAEGGWITCSYLHCPNPTALADILDENEPHHIVTLANDTFTIRHPLRERIGNDLEKCGLHAYLAGLDGPPYCLGRYRVFERINGGGYGPWLEIETCHEVTNGEQADVV